MSKRACGNMRLIKVKDLLVSFSNLKMNLRFILGLKGYYDNKFSFDDAHRIIVGRVAQREENFLKMLKVSIFGFPKSPYLPLLKLKKYEYGDVENLISRNGLEETLNVLCDDGVYLTIEEFKGWKPVIRNGREVRVDERDFNNPFSISCFERRSGGTRGESTRVLAGFDFLSQTAVHRGIVFDIRKISSFPQIIIWPAFPYGVGMKLLLHLSKFKIYPHMWISLVDDRHYTLSSKSKISMTYILLGRLFGEKFPKPIHCTLKNISFIVEHIRSFLDKYGKCCVLTSVSTALRLCQTAKEKGIRFEGLIFYGGGEPFTKMKMQQIQSAGASFIINYAFAEAGFVGSLCTNSTGTDDIHLCKDKLALITYNRKVFDYSVNAFLFTSLLPSAPKILLNVESGDCGIVEERNCSCPYFELGYDIHMNEIRSFEKLTSEGMTFYGRDLLSIIEEILPSLFGGSSLDYQLVEEECESGITRLVIFVSPDIGELDENNLVEVMIEQLKRQGSTQQVMADLWCQANTITVRRDHPILTEENKLYPLYALRKAGK